MKIRRSAGVLMPLASLPSPYGIGTLGKEAYNFIDFLFESNQSWWQILPVGPTSYGDSPYQSFSAFAGNPYYIDLDLLIDDGLLKKEDVESIDFGSQSDKIDYAKLFEKRFDVLRKAASIGIKKDGAEFKRFTEENYSWLPSYALFMALKYHFNMKPWIQWEDIDIRLHKPEAVAKYNDILALDVQFFEYIQYIFMKQWKALHDYAKSKGIGIIGDIPIYVAMDSADVWADREFFLLDEEGKPTVVAGVPPDYFCKDGQLWGNPIYNWDRMKMDGYGWWIRRVDGALKLYDVLRIDHFRGFDSYWAVPYGEKTARRGTWEKGPGLEFVNILTSWFAGTQFIAEDLGVLSESVVKLLHDSKLPGMKVLEFAFSTNDPNDYLPHTYDENCVCYVGTHDNATVVEWAENTEEEYLEYAKNYLALTKGEGYNWGFIRGGMSSVANLFIAQMQDYLGLNADGRINRPGVLGGNWQWRIDKSKLTKSLSQRIANMTRLYGRSNIKYEAYIRGSLSLGEL